MYDKSRNLKFIRSITVLASLIFIIWLVFYLVGLGRFRVLSTDPNVNQVSNTAPYIDIKFNKPLAKSGVRLSATPSIIRSYVIEGNTINLSIGLLSLGGTYKINIIHIEDQSGDTLTNKTIVFTPKYIAQANLPNRQQKAILNNQDNYSSVANNPIVAHLPYSTLSYTLTAVIGKNSANKSQLIINAKIFLNQSDMSDESAAISRYQQDVLSYISSLGLNPNNYDIQYSIVTP